MVLECVEMAVELKLHRFHGKALLISDYEWAYACGWAAGILGMSFQEGIGLDKIQEEILSRGRELESAGEDGKNLSAMIENYKSKGTEGKELEELFQLGMEKSKKTRATIQSPGMGS